MVCGRDGVEGVERRLVMWGGAAEPARLVAHLFIPGRGAVEAARLASWAVRMGAGA